ncbi:MAG: SET domain-containing protein [Bacteroidetes bacterium]|nr:MAG: SET domain-containing protein [Bacteroidota bacterium]REK05807.1 MAG: SET domain-containing protein [Bacteroidota bacterium]REK31889.1 MAG: SET domain-containing protein [Bacteroidota bacterium]REK49954.1 MAG: SET domain-containing protein [Bacteroidota bacterium]
MPHLDKHLYLKKSQLPGAGLGLFTKIDIEKGTRITEYKGRLVEWKDVKHEDGYNAYIFRLNRSLAINALPYKKSFGRYANDARGMKRIKGFRNNADYIVEGKKCYLDAIRPIKKGEEIFVEYGGNFWKLIRKIRLKQIKQKT